MIMRSLLEHLKSAYLLISKIILCALFFVVENIFANAIFLNINGDQAYLKQVTNHYSKTDKNLYIFPNEDYRNLNGKNIEEVLLHIETYFINRNNNNISYDFLISAHHGGGEFSGKNGQINIKEINLALFNHSWLKNSVTHVYADGCYTVTLSMVKNNQQWRQLFPNVEVIFGNQGQSWPQYSRNDINAVQSVLNQWHDWSYNKDSKGATKDSLRSVSDWDSATFAVWIGDPENPFHWEYYTTAAALNNRKPIVMDDIFLSCNRKKTTLNSYVSIAFKNFYPAKDFLFSESESRSELRATYNWLRKNEHCFDFMLWDVPLHSEPNRLIRLLYWNNIINNFLGNTGNLSQSSLNSFSVDNYEIALPELDTITRYDLILRVKKLDLALNRDKRLSYFSEINTLKEYVLKLKQLVELNPVAIPLNWAIQKDSTTPPLFENNSFFL